MPNPLVEPTTEAVQPSQVSSSGAAQAASDLLGSGGSAASMLKEGMQKLSPAKQEQSSAQKISESQKKEEAPPAETKPEKKEFPEIGTSDIKEKKQVETQLETPGEDGSALESFRKGLLTSKRAKEKAAIKAAKEEEVEGEPAEKKEEPKEEKKEEVTSAVKTDGEDAPVTEEEIQKTISDPAISKRHQKRMVFLANKAKELEKKLAEAEAKPQTNANDDKIKELTEKQAAAEKELIQFQRRYSLESEPELKKFDEVAQKADEAIYSKLKGRISDKTLDLIKGMGGFGGFSRSGQVFNIEVEVDGVKTTQPITASQLARRWLTDMDVEDAEFIKAKLGERVSAIEAKKARSDALVAESENWFKEKQTQQAKQAEEQQARAKEYQSTYDTRLNDWIAKQESLKDRTVPATATPEEKKEIENYNKHNAGIRAMVKMAIAPTSIDDHIAIVQEAANSLVLSRDNSNLKKENESLKQQLEKIKAGVSTTGKPGGGSLSKVKEKPKDDSASESLKTPVTESLRAGLERLRQQSSE